MKNYLSSFTVFLVFALMVCEVKTESDVWRRIIRFDGLLSQGDYDQSKTGARSPYIGTYSLELYNNGSFTFSMPAQNSDKGNVLTVRGSATRSQQFSLEGQEYALKSTELEGLIKSSINWGIKWSFKINIGSYAMQLERQEVRYQFMNWGALAIFMSIGLIIFPLVDRTRNKVLYNIKLRTNIFMEFLILIKILWVWQNFMINCFYELVNMRWYFYIVQYAYYLFTFGPSLLNCLYFITTMQKRVKDYEWFKGMSVTTRCIIMMLIFLSIPAIAIGSLFVQKGIYVYFGLSVVVFYQFYYSCKRKKYTFGRVLFFDLMLTAILMWYGYFLPSLNFLPLTLKDLIIFWNYYLGLFIFGVIASKIGIKMEMTEQVYVDQFSESVPELGPKQVEPLGPTDSERRHQQMPEIRTSEGLSS